MKIGGIVDAASQYCSQGSSSVCVALSIPVTASTTSDNADLLVSVSGPGNLGWVGFGFGSQMLGSLLFVMWQDNNNLVISPRLAT